MRRAHRQPARARPERHDPDAVLRHRGRGPADALPARGAGLRQQGGLAGHRGLQPRPPARPTTRRTPPRPPGRRRRRAWTPRRATPTPPPSGSGSAPRGTAGRTSTTSRSRASPSSTTSRRRARSSPRSSRTPPPPARPMAQRRLEDERFAAFAEVAVVWLDLPDAVFRGYEGDDQLLGAPRADDPGAGGHPAPRDRPPGAVARLPADGHRRPRGPPARAATPASRSSPTPASG